jgi:4-alpha-glucanotransferase
MSGTASCCLDRRGAGVLLHLSSLPGPGACGQLGPAAFRFVEFLAACGMAVWQMLPVGPTAADGSPYQSGSVHAGNRRFIAAEPLVAAGWLDAADAQGEVDVWLARAWRNFRTSATASARRELEDFCRHQAYWLEDYALFAALQDDRPGGWWSWPTGLRDREPQAMAEARARLHERIALVRFEQFLFFTQWAALKAHANARGVRLFGDMPIFVAHDSAEVWAHRDLFSLDERGLPTVVAGVPPDYFSATGQRWGNPLYRWDALQRDGFRFWIDRLCTQLKLFDLVRIDHFRGFEAYWEIPASEPVAVHGRWVQAPGKTLFERLHEVYDPLPVVAEDLGVITAEVEALRDGFGLPGMKILQFAFSGGPANPYLPYNHPERSVVYTGTHDNDTTVGWFAALPEGERAHVEDFLGRPTEAMPWPLIRCALASPARLAIVPMQDLLALDGRHRMNLPGTHQGNWLWRFEWEQVPPVLAGRVRHLVSLYGRLRGGG